MQITNMLGFRNPLPPPPYHKAEYRLAINLTCDSNEEALRCVNHNLKGRWIPAIYNSFINIYYKFSFSFSLFSVIELFCQFSTISRPSCVRFQQSFLQYDL